MNVEQPLASPGSANNYSVERMRMGSQQMTGENIPAKGLEDGQQGMAKTKLKENFNTLPGLVGQGGYSCWMVRKASWPRNFNVVTNDIH